MRRQINRSLRTKKLGRCLMAVESLDSTNAEVRRRLETAGDGFLVVAEEQWAGRGSHQRTWESEKSQGIYMSLLLKRVLPPERIPGITLLAALSIIEALEAVCDIRAQIKWPNDVLLGGKKIAGILAEVAMDQNIPRGIILGIGMNTAQGEFSEVLSEKATSIWKETGKRVDRGRMIATICNNFEKKVDQYEKHGILKDEIINYNAHLIHRNQEIQVVSRGAAQLVHSLGIDGDGRLMIRRPDGTLDHLGYGEISIRGVRGYI